MTAMSEALREGMTPTVSNWGDNDMSWLDGVSGCHGTCGDPTVHFSNFQF